MLNAHAIIGYLWLGDFSAPGKHSAASHAQMGGFEIAQPGARAHPREVMRTRSRGFPTWARSQPAERNGFSRHRALFTVGSAKIFFINPNDNGAAEHIVARPATRPTVSQTAVKRARIPKGHVFVPRVS